MKHYTMKVFSKETARALTDIFINGLEGDYESRSPEEREAIDMITRLGEWAEEN